MENEVEGFLGDHRMSLPYTYFEFVKTAKRLDKREKFFVFNIHLLSGSTKQGCQYTIDLEDGGRTLVVKSHIRGGGISERFLNSKIFKQAFSNKVRQRTYHGLFEEGDIDEIATAFDHHVCDVTDQFNTFEEWTMKFTIPTEFPGRDIVERFPIYKMVKSSEREIGKDIIHSLCTIVRLDWEDKESGNLKTPSTGIVIDTSSDEEDEDEYDRQSLRKKRLRTIDASNGNGTTTSQHQVSKIYIIHLYLYILSF